MRYYYLLLFVIIIIIIIIYNCICIFVLRLSICPSSSSSPKIIMTYYVSIIYIHVRLCYNKGSLFARQRTRRGVGGKHHAITKASKTCIPIGDNS